MSSGLLEFLKVISLLTLLFFDLRVTEGSNAASVLLVQVLKGIFNAAVIFLCIKLSRYAVSDQHIFCTTRIDGNITSQE